MAFRTAIPLTLALVMASMSAAFANPDEDALREQCDWLERAIAREPNRDDAFGMFMQGQRPKCQAFLEAMGRGDGSVQEDALREVVKELKDLREIIDAEHGGPPPALPRPESEASKRKAAAEQARKEEAERKRAAEQTRKEEAERKRAAERARKEEQRAEKEARSTEKNDVKAAEADDEAARQRARDEADARRLMEEVASEAEADAEVPVIPVAPPDSKGPRGELDGTWQQFETRVLDKWVKRTLNLFTRDGKLEGELYEEVWFPAPRAWQDSSCGGRDTFRMVTTARVTGSVRGARVILAREVPRVLTCTCGSRCTVEARRRGIELQRSSNGRELSDASGVFLRPGEQVVAAASTVGLEGGPELFIGTWETRTFSQRDRKVVQRLEVSLVEGELQGVLYEKSTQALPLSDWSERFCGGASSWDWVTQWRVSATAKGRKLALKARDGSYAICTCPSKCAAPKAKLSLSGELGVTGQTLELDAQVFERR